MRSFVIPERLELLEEVPEQNGVLSVEDVLDGAEPAALVKDVTRDLSNKGVLCIQQQDLFDKVYAVTKAFHSLPEGCQVLLADSLASNLFCLIPALSSVIGAATALGATPTKSKKAARHESDDDDSSEVVDEDPEDDDAATASSEVAAYRNCYKIYTYFLYSMLMALEGANSEDGPGADGEAAGGKAAKGKGGRPRKAKAAAAAGLQWESQRQRVLRVMADAASVRLVQLYQGAKPEQRLLDLFCKVSLKMYENKDASRDVACRKEMNRLLAACAVVQDYLVPVTTGVLHLLLNSTEEHIGEFLAGVGETALTEYRSPQVTSALLQEISRASPKEYARANSGAHQAGDFLVAVAERQPRVLAAHLSLLIPHLDYGESYVLRNAIVTSLGKLVVHESGMSNESAPAAEEAGQGEEAVARARRLRSKQGLLAVLLERARDTTAFVRSRVLQTWTWLCEQHAIPLGHWNAVVDMAAGRLKDKSSLVRRSALQLLGTLLQQNPFGPELQVAEFEITLEKYRSALASHAAAAEAEEAAREELSGDGLVDEEGAEVSDDAQTSADGAQSGLQAEADALESGDKEQEQRQGGVPHAVGGAGGEEAGAAVGSADGFGLEQTRALVASLEAGLKFTKMLSESLDTLALLLASSTTSDVEHCIQLLIAMTQFRIDGAHSCLRKVLPLALSNEPNVRDSVEKAIAALHLDDRSPEEAAKSLMGLAGPEATLGELAALEALMQRFMQGGQITTGTIFALWDFFAFHQPGTTPAQSTAALVLLAMAAKGKPSILSRRIPSILDIGLGRRAANNPTLARYACIALQRVSEEDKQELQEGHRVFATLAGTILNQGSSAAGGAAVTGPAFPVTQQAVRAIYHLHPAPEKFCASILRKLAKSLFSPMRQHKDQGPVLCSPSVLRDRTNLQQEAPAAGSCANSPESAAGDVAGPAPAADPEAESVCGNKEASGGPNVAQDSDIIRKPGVPGAALSHFVFASGHVAMEHLVFVGQVMKAARKAKSQGTSGAQAGGGGAAEQGKKGKEAGRGSAGDALADELGAAAATESELELMQEAIEREVVGSKGERLVGGRRHLVSACLPLVVGLCRSSEIQKEHPSLHAASIVTLSKLMAIDSACCETNLQLLFTLLQKARSPDVRSNIMIALGDLALRWPSLLEPWTEHMYHVLKDPSTTVRRHAVLVLSHLILNDMMKVKGFISELAVCLEDEDKRIADLTGLFFFELSRKGSNTVYNLLPDMLSRMSANAALPEASLRNILQFLIAFLDKDRQMEGLIDKLAHRFGAARDVRLWRTLAFCMSLLTYSERGVRKLAECFKDYKDALVDDEVLQHLLTAVGKSKKFAKPETKALLEEVEQRIQKEHADKKEEEQTAEEAMRAKKAREDKATRAARVKQEAAGDGQVEEGEAEKDEEEGDDEEEGEAEEEEEKQEEQEEVAGARGSRRKVVKREPGVVVKQEGGGGSRQGRSRTSRAAAAAESSDAMSSEASEDGVEEEDEEDEQEAEEEEEGEEHEGAPAGSADRSGAAAPGRGSSGGSSRTQARKAPVKAEPDVSEDEEESPGGVARPRARASRTSAKAVVDSPSSEASFVSADAGQSEGGDGRRVSRARRGSSSSEKSVAKAAGGADAASGADPGAVGGRSSRRAAPTRPQPCSKKMESGSEGENESEASSEPESEGSGGAEEGSAEEEDSTELAKPRRGAAAAAARAGTKGRAQSRRKAVMDDDSEEE